MQNVLFDFHRTFSKTVNFIQKVLPLNLPIFIHNYEQNIPFPLELISYDLFFPKRIYDTHNLIIN